MADELPQVGPWAREKLKRLEKYLSAYTKILSRQSWLKGFIYIDAFAGAGRSLVRRVRSENASGALLELGREFRGNTEVAEILHGSPRVALDVEPPFTHYVFLDLDPSRLQFLRAVEVEYRDRRKIYIREEDCNDYLRDLIENGRTDWKKWRGVVFLDPFGMQVPWKTIALLAQTKALEVFLNFPVGMAIQRLLRRDAKLSDPTRFLSLLVLTRPARPSLTMC
ncbi:MAG: three-Cys-motif partner protein TcmP [Candidatus Binataceae bacterium]